MKKIITEKIILTKKIVFILSLLSLLLILLIVGCAVEKAEETGEDEEVQDEERAARTDRAGLGSASGYRRTIEHPGTSRSSAASSPSPRPSITGAWIVKARAAKEAKERVRGDGETGEECLDSIDCREGLECIDHNCGTIAELYETDCEQKCNFNQITVSTSDGEEYTLEPGEGSYSYAGAIEWKVASVPDYCLGEDTGEIIVPIRLIKKANSQIVGEEVIVLQQGDISQEITHPTISRVSFKITLESIEENC